MAVLILLLLVGTQTAWAQDAGAPATSGVPIEGSLEERVLHNEASLNLMWLVVGAVLVIFMQSGFAMLEVGLARAKNAAHVAMQNFTIFGLGFTAYFAVGYGLQFAAVAVPTIGFSEPIGQLWPNDTFGLFGTSGFFLTGAYDPSILGFFLFQAAFMDTAATIPTGSMAERWRFGAFIWWGLFCGAIYFPIYGAWVWGGGWLSALGVNFGLGNGAVDFAGAGVVHAMGGVAAFMGARVLGPRLGKYGPTGKARTIPGHNVPLSLLGTFILLVGWFGFNAASTFSATDLRMAVVATNTALAAAAGLVSALLTSYYRLGRPDPGFVGNGMLGGLVAVTGTCAFVAPWAAFAIGAMAGVLVVFATLVIERNLRVDDPAGAIAVHGACGLFGMLCVGVFADGTYGAGYNGVDTAVTGILYGSAGGGQLAAQAISCVTVLLFGGGLSYAFFSIQNRISPIRSSRQDEQVGLDVEEIGVLGYADFPVLADAEGMQLLSGNGRPTPADGVPGRAAVESPPSDWEWRRQQQPF